MQILDDISKCNPWPARGQKREGGPVLMTVNRREVPGSAASGALATAGSSDGWWDRPCDPRRGPRPHGGPSSIGCVPPGKLEGGV
jgi:hypothetical protein